MSDASDFDQIGKALGIAPSPQPMVGVNLSDFSDGSPLARAAAARVDVPAPTMAENQAADVESARRMYADPDFMKTVVAAKRNGNALGSAQFVRDQQEMEYPALVNKYGKDIADQSWRLWEAEKDFDETLSVDIGTMDRAMDTSVSIVSGAINSAGGIAALGVGLLSDKAGVEVAKATAAISEKFMDSQSLATRQNAESQQLMDALDANDNQDILESDKSLTSGKSSMEASFESFGRGVLDMADAAWDNPSNALQTAAGGLGSLAPSAVGAKLAAKGAAKLGGRLVTAEQSLAAKVATQQQYVRPAVATAVAATESSGVYTQAVQEILGMDHEELAVNSSRYRELIEAGATPEEARNELAGETGTSAAGKQFGPALLGGAAMSKFEAAPFAIGSKTGALKAIAGETAEEAYQGATGELSTNRAVIENANDGRDQMDGVGEAFTEGAVGGLGMAGVTQGTGLAAEIVTDVSKAAAKRAGEAVSTRMDKIQKGRDDASPVGDKATTERVASIKTDVNATFDALRSKVAEDLDNGIFPDTPEQKARKEEIANEMLTITTMAEDEIAAVPASVAKISMLEDEGDGNPTQPSDRINRLGNIVNAIDEGKMPESEKQTAALYLFDEVMKLSKFAMADLPAEIASMKDDNPVKLQMLNVKEELMHIQRNPKFIEALVAAREAEMNQDPEAALPEVTPDSVREAQTMAVANPKGVNPYFIDIIMDQRTKGQIQFSDEVATNLKLAGDLAREINKQADLKMQVMQEAVDKINNTPAGKVTKNPAVVSKTWLEVRDEIMVEGSARKTSRGKNVMGRSINDFHTDIVQSLLLGGKPTKNRFGEMVTAQDSIEHLGMFAKSMMNKVDAVNKSINSKGATIRFSNLSPDGIMLPADHASAGKIYIQKDNIASVEVAKSIYVEAMAVLSMYNNLANTFGDLNAPSLGELAPLDGYVNVGVKLDSSSINRMAPVGKPGSNTPSSDTSSKPADSKIAAAATKAKAAVEAKAKADKVAEDEAALVTARVKSKAEAKKRFSEEQLSEANDVASIAGLLGLQIEDGKTEIPSTEILLDNKERLVTLYQGVKAGEVTVDDVKAEILNIMSWLKSDILSDDNSAREERAKKGAAKNGEISYIIQLAEELIEVAEVTDKDVDLLDLEVQKRKLKMDRFGANTVVKQEGPYQGMTNKAAYELALAKQAEDKAPTAPVVAPRAKGKKGRAAAAAEAAQFAADLKAKRAADAQAKADVAAESQAPEPTSMDKLLQKFHDRLKGKKTQLVVETRKNAMAGYSPSRNMVSVDLEKIEADFNNGMAYLDGNGETSSQQKAIVFNQMDVNDFKKFIQDSGLETYVQFIIEHELQHARQIANGQKYPADLMDPVAIDMERDANDAGFAAIGYEAKLPDADAEIDVDMETLPLVKNGNGISRFIRAFKMTDKSKSAITNFVKPIGGFLGLLKDNDTINSETKQNVRRLIQKHIPTIIQDMEDRLDTDYEKNKTFRQMLMEQGKSVDSTRIRGAQIFNPTTGKYDQRLLEQAALAAFHWATNATQKSFQDAEQIAKSFKISAENVSEQLVNAVNSGVSAKNAKEELGRIIMEFWGVQADNSVTQSDTRGIAESVAAELLAVIANRKELLVQTSMDIPVSETDVSNNRKLVMLNPMTETNVANHDAMKDAPDIIRRIVSPTADPRFFFDAPPARDSKTQKRNKFSLLSVFEKKVLKNVRSIEYKINQPMLDLMLAMGKDRYNGLIGTRVVKDKKMNKNHLRSVTGKNMSNDMGFHNVEMHVAALKAHAEATGQEVSEVKMFFDYYFSKVGRLVMEGFGPQNSKHAREVFVSTDSILDLTDPNGEGAGDFWMTVAQSSDLVKTEKVYRDDSISTIQKKVYEVYGESIAAVQEWMKDPSVKMSDELYAKIQAEVGTSSADKILHSILAVAQYENAKLAGGKALSEFHHNLSIEADGKTDGPINAMIHFMSGKFTAEQIQLLAKGGMFFNKMGMTLNRHIQEYDGHDLYQHAAMRLGQLLSTQRDEMADNDKATKVNQAMLRFLEKFGEVKYEDGEIIIGRGQLKNPLTIKVYGSGMQGINSKVAYSLMNEIYEQMSELAQLRETNPKAKLKDLPAFKDYQNIEEDLAILTSSIIYKKKGEWKTFSKGSFSIGDPVDFTLNADQEKQFAGVVQNLFVKPMIESIEEMMSATTATTKLIQKSTQVQAAVLIEKFNKAIDKETKAQRKSGKLADNEILSKDDYDRILLSLQEFAPIIENEDQSIHLGLSESADSQYSLSRSLTGDFRQEASMAAPSEARVSASPNLTQNRGDGLMINNILANLKFPEKALYVYDGVELAADRAREYGALINEAVTKGWLTNPVMDASDSFQSFLRIGGHEGITSLQSIEILAQTFRDEESQEMVNLQNAIVTLNTAKTRVLNIQDQAWTDKGAKKTAADQANVEYQNAVKEVTELGQNMFTDLILELGANLKQEAVSIQARKNTMKRLGFSTDHMASTETPNDHEGILFEGLDGADLADKINEIYNEELAKLEETVDLVEKPTDAFMELVQANATNVEGTTVYRMDGATLLKTLESKESTLNADQRKILAAVRKAVDWEMSIVFGSQEELAGLTGNPDIGYGQMSTADNTIWVVNTSAETVLHELIHATTIAKVYAYYMTPETVLKEDREAIRRLEALMDEFLRMDPSIGTTNEGLIISEVQEQIRAALENKNEDPAVNQTIALNEFMAWTLTNQNLIDVAKKTTVRNPAAVLVGKAIELMRRLMGFEKRDMWSNVVFNTSILASTKVSTTVQLDASMTLSQVIGGHNPANADRLSTVIMNYRTKLAARLKSKDTIVKDEAKVYLKQAVETVDRLAAAGFAMTMQEKQAFMMIQANLQANNEIDSTSMLRVQKFYDDFLADQDYTIFMETPSSEVDDEHVAAQSLFNALTSLEKNSSNKEGVSNLLTSFVALSQTSEKMRTALGKIDAPKAVDISTESVDDFLTTVANSGLTAMGMSIDEGNKNKTVSQALDKLALKLSAIEDQAENYVVAKSQEMLSRGDGFASRALASGTERIAAFAERRSDTAKNRASKGMYQTAGAVAALLNKERGAILGNEVISLTNSSNLWKPVRDLISEVIGITDETSATYLMVDKVKAQVSAVRQAFREVLPKIFKSKFKSKISEHQWTQMYIAMGKTDIAALQGYQVKTVFKMMTDKASLANETKALEGKLAALVPAQIFKEYQRKSYELADKMMGKGTSVNQLRNAQAISMLLNETYERRAIDLSNPEIIGLIDKLVSLYAFDRLSTNQRNDMKDLVENESEGLEFMVHYLDSLRKAEDDKTVTVEGQLNGWKGYIPSDSQGGLSLVLANDSQHSEMLQRGYTFLRAHKSIGTESRGKEKKGYYFSSVAGRNTYSQGIMQTVQSSVNGVDPLTGRSLNGGSAGAILGKEVGHLRDAIKNDGKQGIVEGAMMPVFGQHGVIVAYEFAIDEDVQLSMNKNTNLGEMIGAWAGRQNEEKLATEYNRLLVDRSLENLERDTKAGRLGEYIWLNDPKIKDKVYGDSWDAVPMDMQNYIKEKFPNGKFMVRKDMIDNIVGYRDPSVADAFTGNTRMDQRVSDTIRDVSTVFFGDKAFEYLVTAEKSVQTAVTIAKQTIVIRSVFVPAMNAASNVMQLLASGVSPKDIVVGSRQKLVEIDGYLKNAQKIIELDAEIAAHLNDKHTLRRLETRKTALLDANKRMSIHPLIEAGAFSTISEGITDVDEALLKGKYVDWVEAGVAKLPEGVQVVGKNLLLTKDTALFQGMSKAVQYGDFVAKAIYYDHVIKNMNQTPEQALVTVFSEFVNFNLLPGRTRTYAEKMGATWFWAFKLRSMKVARRMVIDNPARALMSTFLFPMVTPSMGIGSPITDNFASVWAGGRLDGSIGLGMLERAPTLNPWYNLFN